ncbi:phospholipid-binding lipoprotein MlaA [Rhodovulum imhoffii]|uniref:Phospholipid-binding lipoprotein MlaA n=1 Tax=Rhodovulum imhoffii TaxID=365340 RepID=A0A2T5BUB0_9RHOB|nr:VacJ family lipoprotein [Rhodovulum imhoffii]PTN03001.1 phospholipid-binding lipoprotein MlaA [Rhodovulum imhoffii]
MPFLPQTARLSVTAALLFLAACATSEPPGAIADPYEAQNREVHAANRAIDRQIVRPVSQGYGRIVPGAVRQGVSNFSDNLSLPGTVVNNLLQARPGEALQNTGRFLFNSTIGIAGVFDPSSSIGLYEKKADFGETLHVWGVGAGNYVELPLMGPSTERDVVGKVVDAVLNPMSLVLTPAARTAGRVAWVGEQIGERYTYSDAVDSVLYESADSYAQARSLYLQNRRHELGGGEAPDYFDPYEDPYEQ